MEIALRWYPRNQIFGRAKVITAQEVNIRGFAIPKGTKTDGASLPWFVRAFLPPLGDYFPAALLHDYLLSQGKHTRKEAAHQFKRALKNLGMPAWLVNSFYAGVRINDHWQALKGNK